MSSKYRNKYRIESTRMTNWNYGWKGYYYITINTHQRIRHFGRIINGRMILSETGKIAMDELLKTPEIRPDMNITIDTYVIMPDHIHAILHIGRNPYNSKDATPGVSKATPGTLSIKTDNTTPIIHSSSKQGPQRNNLSSILRGYKSAVTVRARQINPSFKWQERFHDRVIRDARGLSNVRRYIRNNPRNWKG